MARLNIEQQAKAFRRRYGARAIEVAARTRNLSRTRLEKNHWGKVIRALEGTRKNPSARTASRDEYARVAKLYQSFTGHDAEPLARVSAPAIPKVAALIGELDGVLYTTVRDGNLEKYIHKFHAKDKPLLCASADGRVFLLGGNYDFTERGIVDASDK